MKKILLSLIVFSLFFGQTHATDTRVKNIFERFQNTIESKHSTLKQQELYESVRDIITQYRQKNISTEKSDLIDDLLALNNEALYDIWLNNEYTQSNQKIREISMRKSLSQEIHTPSLPSSVKTLTALPGISYVGVNSERELVESGSILRLVYSSYFKIESFSVAPLSLKKGIIVYDEESEEYRFIESYNYEKKIPYSELGEKFKAFLTYDSRVQNTAGKYTGYNFTKFRFFDDLYGVYEDQLEASGFDYNSTLLYRDEDGKYNFITEYDSHVLVSDEDIFGVAQKHIFLDSLREDAKFQTQNMSSSLSQIKSISLSLTQGKTNENSIKEIYNWILDNITYSENIDLSDEKIFSGIETFINREGVCTGYTKLMVYMLMYAGIYDAEVIRGHVIDAPDFPEIGHAWVRIGDEYYDPTFDDPIGNTQARSYEGYTYYKLPKDIFYANRFEYDSLPDGFTDLSKAQINQYIFTYLSNLTKKYEGSTSKYKVFAPVEFRTQYNISANTPITPELLASKTGYYSVENNSFIFIKDGKSQGISGLKYYSLTDENTHTVLKALSYDLSDTYLFNWEVSPGVRQWRLGYEVELR